jgi:CO/xanthine dehydrogenase FAD-binding subunit
MSFVQATTIAEAVAALAGGAHPIAGGSDLVVRARQIGNEVPRELVAIDRVEELRRLDVTDGLIRIGAAVTHDDLVGDETVNGSLTAIADASALVGSPATRHVGTIGGNVMNGSPAMDTGAPLVVLDAVAVLASVRGQRRVPVGELWIGPGRTSAGSDELLVALEIEQPEIASASAYVRLEYRRAMEIAVVGAAASVTLDEDGLVARLRVALSSVAPTILGVNGLDTMPPSDVRYAAQLAADAASAQCHPISDLRASDRYRRHCVAVMTRRAVSIAAQRASGHGVAVPASHAHQSGASS